MHKPELIVALDLPSAQELTGILRRLPDTVRWFKVGLELFTAEGPAVLKLLREYNKKIFLDLKLHDIPNTVARAVSAAARLEVNMLTLHACGGRAMLQAAADAGRSAARPAPLLIAVTTLTSLNQSDLQEIGFNRTLNDHALALGRLALDSGMDGLVASVLETQHLRAEFGTKPVLVTPGIRPAGAETGDQKRIATPAMAAQSGSNFLVVGRPILAAADMAAAAQAILHEIAAAHQQPIH